MKTIYMIRHGESEFNRQKRFAGWTDCQLTELGINQAAEAALKLDARDGIEAVFSSDLIRAKRTAQVIADKLERPLHITEALRETNLGAWEGLTVEEIEDRDPELIKAWFNDYCHFKYPGGESIAQMLARTHGFVDTIMADYDNVLIVGHAGVISSLLSYYLFGDISKAGIFRIKNAKVQRIVNSGNHYALDLFNG